MLKAIRLRGWKHLKKLMEYVEDPAQGIWLQPVGTVTTYIKEQRGISN
jgi:hypothetical protein